MRIFREIEREMKFDVKKKRVKLSPIYRKIIYEEMKKIIIIILVVIGGWPSRFWPTVTFLIFYKLTEIDSLGLNLDHHFWWPKQDQDTTDRHKDRPESITGNVLFTAAKRVENVHDVLHAKIVALHEVENNDFPVLQSLSCLKSLAFKHKT